MFNLPHHMIYKGFVTISVVLAKITMDIYRKVACKIFYFGTTLNALVNSPTTPWRQKKIYCTTKYGKALLIFN
jgi:hypothetical protein